MMHRIAAAIFCLAVLFGTARAADSIPANIQAAVADGSRPEADTARDGNRMPAEVVAFAGLQPGDKVADVNPGGGYFTRIFAKAVGAQGKVYAMVQEASLARRPESGDAIKAIAADNPQVVFHAMSLASLSAPEPLDLLWTALNYHDFKNMDDGVIQAMNKSIFAALKPGGIYLVIDHAAAAGSGARDTDTLHRVDPELVKQEVFAAGFVLDAESDILRHPEDDYTLRVFDENIRGRTDRFVFRFRKPAQ